MKELAIVTDLRKGPIKPTGRLVETTGPMSLAQESTILDIGHGYVEQYRLEARFGSHVVIPELQAEARRLIHRNLVKALAGTLFGPLWTETFEIERLLYESGISVRGGEPAEEILQILTGIRESTGYTL